MDDRADDFEVRIFVNAAVFAADQYDLEIERAESDHWSQHTPATLAAAIAETLLRPPQRWRAQWHSIGPGGAPPDIAGDDWTQHPRF